MLLLYSIEASAREYASALLPILFLKSTPPSTRPTLVLPHNASYALQYIIPLVFVLVFKSLICLSVLHSPSLDCPRFFCCRHQAAQHERRVAGSLTSTQLLIRIAYASCRHVLALRLRETRPSMITSASNVQRHSPLIRLRPSPQGPALTMQRNQTQDNPNEHQSCMRRRVVSHSEHPVRLQLLRASNVGKRLDIQIGTRSNFPC